jgi:hypothetical protein
MRAPLGGLRASQEIIMINLPADRRGVASLMPGLAWRTCALLCHPLATRSAHSGMSGCHLAELNLTQVGRNAMRLVRGGDAALEGQQQHLLNLLGSATVLHGPLQVHAQFIRMTGRGHRS